LGEGVVSGGGVDTRSEPCCRPAEECARAAARERRETRAGGPGKMASHG
jgi:hypothetical protein